MPGSLIKAYILDRSVGDVVDDKEQRRAMDAGFRTGDNSTGQSNGQMMANAVRFMVLYKNISCKAETKTSSRSSVVR